MRPTQSIRTNASAQDPACSSSQDRPGTGGRKKETEMSNEALGKRFGLCAERVSQILRQNERDERAGRTRWMSTAERRAEAQKHWGRGSA